jgi:type II secretory pathway pseudopilin PulG
MIVIAIIGILAAIAIPNFIAYRNKSFCSAAESDANAIASALASYYSIPTRTADPTGLNITTDLGDPLSGQNSADITGNLTGTIAISVTDGSGRCPTDYTGAMTAANNPRGYWSTEGENPVYIKTMTQ